MKGLLGGRLVGWEAGWVEGWLGGRLDRYRETRKDGLEKKDRGMEGSMEKEHRWRNRQRGA